MTKKLSQRFNDRRRVQIAFPEQGLTKQAFRDECNINTLMAQYQKVDMRALALFNDPTASFRDCTDVADYQTACNIVISAQEMFDALPSSVRSRFENDPSQFLEFTCNPDNVDELRKMGLMEPEILPEPLVVPESPIDSPPA